MTAPRTPSAATGGIGSRDEGPPSLVDSTGGMHRSSPSTGDVLERSALTGAQAGKLLYQRDDAFAQQGLAAGEAYLLYAQADENPDHAQAKSMLAQLPKQ